MAYTWVRAVFTTYLLTTCLWPSWANLCACKLAHSGVVGTWARPHKIRLCKLACWLHSWHVDLNNTCNFSKAMKIWCHDKRGRFNGDLHEIVNKDYVWSTTTTTTPHAKCMKNVVHNTQSLYWYKDETKSSDARWESSKFINIKGTARYRCWKFDCLTPWVDKEYIRLCLSKFSTKKRQV